MKTVFTIYDSKVNHYWDPVVFLNKGEALRTFEEGVNRRNQDGSAASLIGQHPQDFTLFEIGYYDELTGKYLLHDAKIAICTMNELVRRENERPVMQVPPDLVEPIRKMN